MRIGPAGFYCAQTRTQRTRVVPRLPKITTLEALRVPFSRRMMPAGLCAHPFALSTGLNAVIKKKAVSRPSLSQVQTNLHAMALDAAGPVGGPGGPEHGFAGAQPQHAQHGNPQPQQYQQHPPPPYQQHAQHAAPPQPGPAAGLPYGQAYQGQAPQQQYVGMGTGV